MSMPSQAVLVATGTYWHSSQPTPAELLHLVDRPVVQHAIEIIAALGCSRVDVVLGSVPERFEAVIGDGQRWGIEVRYHLAREPERPYGRIAAIPISEADVLLAHADRLPRPDIVLDGRVACAWGVLPRDTLHAIPSDMSPSRIERWLSRRWELPVPLARDRAQLLEVTNALGFLRSSRVAASGGRSDLLRTGRERAPGIWVGWGAQVHASARLEAPVFVGEQARIGADVEIGPHAVIGAEAFIADGSRVSEAVIQPRTYVGDALTVERAVASDGWLMDAELGTGVSVTDPLLLGATELAAAKPLLVRSLVRILAAVTWLASLPLQLATAVFLKLARPGPVLFRTPVHTVWRRGKPSAPRVGQLFSFDPQYGRVGLSAPRSAGLSDILLRLLPGLLSVARGDLALVGLEPRSPRDVALLPEPWRAVANAFPPGLITEIEGRGGLAPAVDAVFAAEAFLAASESFGFRLRLLGRYLLRRAPWATA